MVMLLCGEAAALETLAMRIMITRCCFSFVMVTFLTVSQSVFATSYVEPTVRNVRSPNGKFFVHIDPATMKHDVYAVGMSEPIWSFSRRVWHDGYFVSNNGDLVAWVAWRHCCVQDIKEPAIIVYSSSGIAASYSYAAVCTPRRRFPWDAGPIGDDWRVWRGESEMRGDMIDIDTVGLGRLNILLTPEGIADVGHSRSWKAPLACAVAAIVVMIGLALWCVYRNRRPLVS